MSSDRFSNVQPGEILYLSNEDTWHSFRATDVRYASLDAMSRVQLKILGVYLSELQDQINGRLIGSITPRLNLPPYPTTPAEETPDGPA